MGIDTLAGDSDGCLSRHFSGKSAVIVTDESATRAFHPVRRLQTKDGICEYLGGISHATYDTWHNRGLVPGPVPKTTRYDVRAHDAALDAVGGLTGEKRLSPLEQFEKMQRELGNDRNA